MAAAIVPHRQDYLPDPQSATRFLVTFAPYTGRGRANRMVLPLRAHQGVALAVSNSAPVLGLIQSFPPKAIYAMTLGGPRRASTRPYAMASRACRYGQRRSQLGLDCIWWRLFTHPQILQRSDWCYW